MVWKSGDWYITCDRCGRQIYASEAKHTWDGFIVCPNDYEERHPQDFIRVQVERGSVPFMRPEPDDQFVEVNYTYNTNDISICGTGVFGVADVGTADCAKADYTGSGL